nr:hypothetical protein 1 [Mute swan feces associated picorna-like virus 20]
MNKSSEQRMTNGQMSNPRPYIMERFKENHYKKKKQGKKRDELKLTLSANKANKTKYGPQSGLEMVSSITSSFDDLAKYAGIDMPDTISRHIEGVVALLLNLQVCTTYQAFTSAMFLYVRDFVDKSITSMIMTYISQIICEQDMTIQGTNDPHWLTLLREVQTNWALVKGNKAFNQFSKLLGVIVTLGLCDAADLKFSVHGFKMFDDKLLDKHATAYDLCDAIFGTVTYFAEGMYLCFKTGSIKPLLLNDFAILELDEEYTKLISWWDLVKNGNLERIEGVTDSEFGNRLDKILIQLRNVLGNCTGLDKKLVTDKVTKCMMIKQELVTLKISSGTRRSPFAIELFGESSQGKTTFGDQMLDALLTSANLPIEKEYRAALNPGDKFFSNWTSDKLVAILDDMANEKSDFVEKPPTRAIIDICNNQMYYAPKAELEAKGKCFVEPEIVLATTNKKNLDAPAYSNCPYSIQRRMDLIMTVKCKEQFQRMDAMGRPCGVDSRKVREFYTTNGTYEPHAIEDIWEITIEKAVPGKDITHVGVYEPLVWRGNEMVNVSASEAIACAIEHFNQHRKNQFALMTAMSTRNKTMSKCRAEGCIHLHGYCPDHPICPSTGDTLYFKKQFGIATCVALRTVGRKIYRRFDREHENFLDKIEDASTKVLYDKTNEFLKKWDWICLIPSEYLENERFQEFVCWYYKEDLISKQFKYNWFLWLIVLFSLWINLSFGACISCCAWVLYKILNASKTKDDLIRELKDRNDTLPAIIRSTRDKYAQAICYGSVAIAGLYMISRVYKSWKATQPEQSALEPKTPSDIQKRDEAKNVWTPVYQRTLPTAVQTGSCDGEQLTNLVQKNLRYASVDTGKQRTLMANVFFLKSNVLVIPDHYFETESLEVTCYKEKPEAGGGKFVTRLCKSASYKIPDTDLRICYSSTGGSYRDMTKFLPTDNIVDHALTVQWRAKDGTIISGKGHATAKKTTNGTCMFLGGEYTNLSVNTFNGMCGAVVTSDTKSSVITGIHLGGIEGLPKGCFGTLTKQQAEDAYERLKAMQGVLLTGTAEKFTPQVLGKDILLSTPLHPKSPINHLPENSQFEYYGSCPGQVTSRSDVRKTPISEIVTEICQVENIWGAPKMKPEWYGWQTCLANASHAGKPFPHDLLVSSVTDYKEPLLKLIKSRDWKISPLSDHDNLNGIPNCKFIDAINLKTSIGYPLTGAKSKFVKDVEPDVDGNLNREFDDVIKEEIKRVEDCYKNGQRAFTIAKACKKDEVLPVAKGKCRIFYGNPIALTFLVRKYFLPVLRFLQMNPLVSECAVGINCHGPEWDEFYNHAMSFGKDRMFGGDYGKYDQKIPSQLLLAAMRILIDLAREKDYTQEDLSVMETMAGDLVYSLIAFNGDLVGLQEGTHISGNSLTVILNGICGSLNLRNYFYTKYPKSVPFREAAHMMTYGDDNIGTVHPDYPEFNIKGCSEFLATYGQIYTMPDKESELTPYLKEGEFEFLKRTSVYHPELGVNLGALADKSIFKSLHCYMRPKGCPNTPKEACAINIDTGLREWFNHGPDTYEFRRKQMQEIAEKAEIAHMCTMLTETYEDRLLNWEYTYTDKEKPVCKQERFSI